MTTLLKRLLLVAALLFLPAMTGCGDGGGVEVPDNVSEKPGGDADVETAPQLPGPSK